MLHDERIAGWLARPGRPGAFGALMDLYAAAAADLCETVEAVAPERFAREVEMESADPDGASIRAVCRHVVRAGWGHMNYIRRVRGLPVEPTSEVPMASPADLRPLLAAVLRYAETAVEGLTDSDEVLAPLRFQVGWGPTYDPEMMLEHTIVHLQRHRRQIARWPRLRSCRTAAGALDPAGRTFQR